MTKSSGQGDGGKKRKPAKKGGKATPKSKAASKKKKGKPGIKPVRAPKPEDLPEESWERLPSEPAMWFSRFEIFRNKGPERRLLESYRQWLRMEGRYPEAEKAARIPGAWSKQSRKWHWKMRAEQWDAEHRKKRNERNDRVLAELEEQQIELGLQGIKKCKVMLGWPLQEQTTSQDGKTVVIKPAGWNFNTISKLMTASTLQIREAIGAMVGNGGRAAAADGENSSDAADYIPEEQIAWLFHEFMDEVPQEGAAQEPET